MTTELFTMLTTLTFISFASWITMRPTAELAAFCTMKSSGLSFTKSWSMSIAVAGLSDRRASCTASPSGAGVRSAAFTAICSR